MAAPTFIQEAETSWGASTVSKTTASFNVLTGDVLVAFAEGESESVTLTFSGGSLIWTLQQSNVQAGSATEYIWTATVDADKAMTCTFTYSAGTSHWFGGNVLTFRGSNGIGASAKATVATGAPTLDITTTQANSAIVVANADWNAVDGASRVWRTGAGALTEQTYDASGVTTNYVVYGGFHADAGAVGTKTVGLSAPSTMKYTLMAVEVLGTAAAASGWTPTFNPIPFMGGH